MTGIERDHMPGRERKKRRAVAMVRSHMESGHCLVVEPIGIKCVFGWTYNEG